jgi:hypothetical protein
VAGLCLVAPPADAVLISMDGAEVIDARGFDDRDIITIDSTPGSAEAWLDWDEAFLYEDLDALTFLPNGNLIVSVSGASVVGGLPVEDGDLLEIDLAAGTASYFLRESSLGNLDIDAAHRLPDGHLLLSFHRDEEIQGLAVRDGDVVEVDPEDLSVSIFLSEDVFDVDADVNGLAILPNGHLLITADENVVLAGLPLEDSEIAELDLETGEASIFLSFESRVGQADVDAIALPPGCDDGVDNDGDGRTDAEDTGCSSPSDDSERDAAAPCDDGLDNDADGLIDHAPDPGGDPGCVVPAARSESPECQDGVDNQGDGTIDYDGGLSALGAGSPGLADPDPSCILPWQEREGAGACGLGLEIALLLLPIAWLRCGRSPTRLEPQRPFRPGSPDACAPGSP